jgi:hypothetical protein
LDGRFYQNKTLNRLSGMGTLSIFFKSWNQGERFSWKVRPDQDWCEHGYVAVPSVNMGLMIECNFDF